MHFLAFNLDVGNDAVEKQQQTMKGYLYSEQYVYMRTTKGS